jgi:hypothetical protein
MLTAHDIEQMSAEALAYYISKFPKASACDRAYVEKLEQILETKRLAEGAN